LAELALTVKETAKALGISESAVYWMVYRGGGNPPPAGQRPGEKGPG